MVPMVLAGSEVPETPPPPPPTDPEVPPPPPPPPTDPETPPETPPGPVPFPIPGIPGLAGVGVLERIAIALEAIARKHGIPLPKDGGGVDT